MDVRNGREGLGAEGTAPPSTGADLSRKRRADVLQKTRERYAQAQWRSLLMKPVSLGFLITLRAPSSWAFENARNGTARSSSAFRKASRGVVFFSSLEMTSVRRSTPDFARVNPLWRTGFNSSVFLFFPLTLLWCHLSGCVKKTSVSCVEFTGNDFNGCSFSEIYWIFFVHAKRTPRPRCRRLARESKRV